jgi:urease accessory protein
MGWHGHLELHYRRQGARTIALDRHDGPLRVLQRLYPEGEGICHHVLVHPPGGIVGGDTLAVDVRQDPGTHAVITTPSATRFYRSAGPVAVQQVRAHVAQDARLEWLPLESIAYNACQARNELHFDLAPGAQMLGWDMLALGLPAAGLAFEQGCVTQHVEWPGVWLERGHLDARDTLLLDSPVGLAGQRVMGTVWLATGSAWPSAQRAELLELTRTHIAASPLAASVGVTSPNERLIVCRSLAPMVEPVFALWQSIRALWRQQAWGLAPVAPRIWAM